MDKWATVLLGISTCLHPHPPQGKTTPMCLYSYVPIFKEKYVIKDSPKRLLSNLLDIFGKVWGKSGATRYSSD